MAIKKDIVIQEYAITLNDCYIRIDEIKRLNKNNMDCVIGFYNNAENIDTQECVKFKTKTYNVAYDIDGLNPFAQAYEFIKQCDEFKNGVDI